MKELMKWIDEVKIEYACTLDELNELDKVLRKHYVLMDGDVTEDGCRCPKCGTLLVKGGYHCPCCGQWVKYIESDTIPL